MMGIEVPTSKHSMSVLDTQLPACHFWGHQPNEATIPGDD